MFRNRTFRPRLLCYRPVVERTVKKYSSGFALVDIDPNDEQLPDLSDYNLKNLLDSGQNLEYVNPIVTAKNSDVHLSETAASMVNNVSRETQNDNSNENGNT